MILEILRIFFSVLGIFDRQCAFQLQITKHPHGKRLGKSRAPGPSIRVE